MSDELLELVRREITNNAPPEQIRSQFKQQGYDESAIDAAIQQVRADETRTNRSTAESTANLLAKKELCDRIGYGFVPHQFINILFYLTGAGYFLVGMVNGAKTILDIVFSSVFRKYGEENVVSPYYVSTAGYIYGFSFLGMGFAVFLESVPLFALFILVGSVGVASHGDLYDTFVKDHLKPENRTAFLAKSGGAGVLLTAVSILVSGWILEYFPRVGSKQLYVFGSSYPVYGYLISFEITALAFILSGLFVSRIKEDKQDYQPFLEEYWSDIRAYLGTFVRNKRLFLLMCASIIVSFVEGLGNSYYGIYIYEHFTKVAFGGFLNVGAIFFIAIIASLFGPAFSKKMRDVAGLTPTLVFGTLLIAMMPFVLVYNPQLWAIGTAAMLAVVGSSIVGVSQGLLARELLREDERRVYFSAVSVAGVVPYLVFFPLGSWYASQFGLEALFTVLGGVLVAVAVPLYFVLVFMQDD